MIREEMSGGLSCLPLGDSPKEIHGGKARGSAVTAKTQIRGTSRERSEPQPYNTLADLIARPDERSGVSCGDPDEKTAIIGTRTPRRGTAMIVPASFSRKL